MHYYLQPTNLPTITNLCIIPARGGSKRIPRKNIRPFLGKPIIAYAIELALQSDLFSSVMVSTDDEEIADVAKAYGAEVPVLRSSAAADDYAPLKAVVDEVLAYYRSANFRYACCLLPTAVLAQAQHLRSALELLAQGDFYSVRPVVPFSYPIQRAMRVLDSGEVDWLQPEYALTRSQDLEEAFHDAGQFYWVEASKGLVPEKRGAIVLQPWEVQDIDTLADWRMAELKYQVLRSIGGE
jgi:pseudaminic acid cytidylyltransferase